MLPGLAQVHWSPSSSLIDKGELPHMDHCLPWSPGLWPSWPWTPLAQLAWVPWHCLISNRFCKGGSSPVSWTWQRHPLGALEETGMGEHATTEAQGPQKQTPAPATHALPQSRRGCWLPGELSGFSKRWRSALGPGKQPHSFPLPQRRRNWVKGGRRLPAH